MRKSVCVCGGAGEGIPGSYPPPLFLHPIATWGRMIPRSQYLSIAQGIIDNTSPVSALIMGRLCLSWHIDVRLDAGDLVSVMFCR
ncbi:hypothetical protein CDAR_126481 [Caerostris darwini]|uniref:Uncharacterized protein n=1 Tax=Caerostris darwini TaxID=1538125 RepID=A0AAV4R311_9ARAC|nr:hypothetical protein CDAR_126481 [Caerostris darwini]